RNVTGVHRCPLPISPFISDKIYHIGDITLAAPFDTVHSVLFDSLIVNSGEKPLPAPAIENLEMAYKHKKAIGFGTDSVNIFDSLSFSQNDPGITDIEEDFDGFLNDVKGHRVWERIFFSFYKREIINICR